MLCFDLCFCSCCIVLFMFMSCFVVVWFWCVYVFFCDLFSNVLITIRDERISYDTIRYLLQGGGTDVKVTLMDIQLTDVREEARHNAYRCSIIYHVSIDHLLLLF